MTLEDVLKKVEWAVPQPGGMCCPYCQGREPKHQPSCKLYQFLRVLPKISSVPSIKADLRLLQDAVKDGEYK